MIRSVIEEPVVSHGICFHRDRHRYRNRARGQANHAAWVEVVPRYIRLAWYANPLQLTLLSNALMVRRMRLFPSPYPVERMGSSMSTVKLVHIPRSTSATPPATLAQLEDILCGVSTTSLEGSAFPTDSTASGDQWLDAAIRLSTDHDTRHLLVSDDLNPKALSSLIPALVKRQPGLGFTLCVHIDGSPAVDFSALGENAGILQIQWRLTERLPDLGFFKTASRAGIWNHLVLHRQAATAQNCSAIARQPNIVHSWERVGKDETACDSVPVYRQVRPLPGRTLWQAVNDPVHRHVLLDRFGKDWLSRARVDEDGDRLQVLGSALRYHFCAPDRLPQGYLDEICAMVAAGGTVAATHVRSNLQRAFLIGYVMERNVIVGNSSLKNPRPVYIEAVRRQSGLDLTGFVERGYTSVRPEYRGLGIGTRLLEGLTARAGDRKIFSVIAEDNEATKIIARRNNTRNVAAYFSQQAGKRVGIWMPAWMIAPHEREDV
jgi:GNAT superfamily N-acetyltransferase